MNWKQSLVVGLALMAGAGYGADLQGETVQAWDRYVASIHARMDADAGAGSGNCFLWADETPGRLARVRSGEVLVAPVDRQEPRHIPGGLIHHWIGAIFIPGVSLREVLNSVRDYRRYPELYPSVVSARVLEQDGSVDRFQTVERHKSMFSHFALDAAFVATYKDLGDGRAYSTSRTTRLQQIDHYGDANQVELEPDAPSAYVWSLNTVTRYEQRDGGVYLELEGMVLSRTVPTGLGWLVYPFVRHAAEDTMAAALRETRDAVEKSHGTSFISAMPASVSVKAQ